MGIASLPVVIYVQQISLLFLFLSYGPTQWSWYLQQYVVFLPWGEVLFDLELNGFNASDKQNTWFSYGGIDWPICISLPDFSVCLETIDLA